MNEPTPKPAAATSAAASGSASGSASSAMKKRRDDDTTTRLFNHNPAALSLHKEGKKMRREQARKEWYAKHGGSK